MGVGVARAKLLLFGEHSAVYGHPAVGRALPWTVAVRSELETRQWELPGLGGHRASVEALLDRFVALARREGLSEPRPGRLEITTDIPLASGFGSSGALCAALVNLFWPNLALETRDKLAWEAEGQFHGTPSGIDTALALREGWWSLDPSARPAKAFPLPDPGLVLIVGAVVRESDTKTLVAGLRQRRAEGDRRVLEALERLGAIATQAVAALSSARSAELPPLVAQAREGLKTLGLESPRLRRVLDAGLASPGAQAGKLSGAGGGGAFFLVFESIEAARAALPNVAASVAPSDWTSPPLVLA